MRTRPKKGSRTLAPDPAELVAPDQGDTVTRLRSIGTDGTSVSVMVGNKSVAKIDASDLEQLQVAAGAEWTADLADQLFDAAAKLAARKHALRLVAARPRARADLIRRLRIAGHADRHAAAAADALENAGVINDADLAEAAATTLASRAGTSRRAIETKLRRRGISAADASKAAGRATEDLDEREAAVELATKRASRQRQPTDPTATKRRLFAFLLRRGFNSDDARYAVEQALKQTDQHTTDELH
ncbi:MAG: RecX family transcriptional regulator [Planctomycetota bacterium]